MPELPEVETVCRGLNQVSLAQSLVGGEVLYPGTFASPSSVDEFLGELPGRGICQWSRRGKYLLAELKDLTALPSRISLPSFLVVHLRMTGQLLWLNRGESLQKHTRVRFFFENGQELRFVDQRTFGKIWWIPPGYEVTEIVTGLGKMGPEPFSPEFSVDYLIQRFRGRQRPIKTALLDQTLIAGLGNIYADEVLFLAGIDPRTECGVLTVSMIEHLLRAIREVLERAIGEGGTTFSNFLNVQGVNGNYGGVAWVYKREGEFCRICETPIRRIKLGGRSSHFCPQCQGSRERFSVDRF